MMIAVIMECSGVPGALFALGMYLPLELNLPALVGGVIAHFLSRRAAAAGEGAGPLMRERGVHHRVGVHGRARSAACSWRRCACSHGSRGPGQTPFFDYDPTRRWCRP